MSEAIMYGIVLIYGILIGSFLNVCIFRIPNEESIVTKRSHCMNCNKQLKWYELIPVFSFLFLRGKCSKCKTKLSIQYPIIEALNGILYVLVFYLNGWDSLVLILLSSIYCFTVSALIVLSVIDFRKNIIPFGVNIFIFVMGLAAVAIKFFGDGKNIDILIKHGIGFFAVSLFFLILYYATKGRGMGGGDIKLMAAAGVLLGWQLILLAAFIGCVLASIIHPLRMKISKAGRVLAFGPYLAIGIFISLLWGEGLLDWYINTFLM